MRTYLASMDIEIALKKRIIESSLELFINKGCKAVTMDIVAKECGISKRTLYEVFQDKSHLLEECIEEFYKQMIDYSNQMRSINDNVFGILFKIHDSQSDVFINLRRDFFLDLKRYYNQIYKKVVVKFIEHHTEMIVAFVKQGQKEGLIKKEINSDLITKIIFEISNIIDDSQIFSLREYSRKELFRDVIIVYFRGLATQKGADLIDEYLSANS